MRFSNLDQWLQWQQTLHPSEIDLGLERVERVYRRLIQAHALAPSFDQVITVAGTNGKGSTVAYYEAWFLAHGISCGCFSSPHLFRYNERIRVNDNQVTDQQLVEAFTEIDQARDEISLTYFEFSTLAALYVFARMCPKVIILEVGLGGRLDAVNILDATLAHITPIGLDHQQWLGETREAIAREKAGILRTAQKVIVNDRQPCQILLDEINRLHCDARFLGVDYDFTSEGLTTAEICINKKHYPVEHGLPGEHQAMNVAGVLCGLEQLGYLYGQDEQMASKGLDRVSLAGRVQAVDCNCDFRVFVDVGHNPMAAQVQRQYLGNLGHCRIVVLLGMLQDKDVKGFVQVLQPDVDEWWMLSLTDERGLSAGQLEQRCNQQIEVTNRFEHPDQAIETALSSLSNQDILWVTGSFLTVQSVVESMRKLALVTD